MKQTAVEWLYERFLFAGYVAPSEWKEKAKEMEKEQIKQAYLDSSRETCLTYGEEPPHDDPKWAEFYYSLNYTNK